MLNPFQLVSTWLCTSRWIYLRLWKVTCDNKPIRWNSRRAKFFQDCCTTTWAQIKQSLVDPWFSDRMLSLSEIWTEGGSRGFNGMAPFMLTLTRGQKCGLKTLARHATQPTVMDAYNCTANEATGPASHFGRPHTQTHTHSPAQNSMGRRWRFRY